MLTRHGGGVESNPGAARLSEVLGHVSFLERPFHPTTFISVARAALRNRQRQYETRSNLAALREARERLDTALQAGRLGTWELQIALGTLIASDTCKAVFGHAPQDEFGYQTLIASIHPDDRDRVAPAVRNALTAGSDFHVEFRNVWPDGSAHWAEVRARLMPDPRGVADRLVGVSVDITARKRDEQMLRDINETLEQRVAARSAELMLAHQQVLEEIAQRERAEEQLRQAQKMEMVGQLTGGVAHDFNNLLMVIITNLELMRRLFPSTPVSNRLIESATQSARRGAALTQRLLAFSRRQELTLAAHDLAELIRGMRDLLVRSLGAAFDLHLDVQDNLPAAAVDSNQLELAILNLVVNARDAMPDGGRIEVSLRLQDPPAELSLAQASHLRIAVTDQGSGMDEDTLRRATEPFFSTKPPGKGTGLGLSMIHGLASQLGGALRLSSSVGSGTTAEIWLPAAGPDVLTVRTATLRADEIVPMEPLNVLLVDDDPLVGEGTRGILETLGHRVQLANSGSAAIACIETGTPVDLLITDYSMPSMTGTQLAQRVRQLRPELPIILASGYAEGPGAEGLELPRLTKPYGAGALAQEILRTMTHRRPGASGGLA